MGRVANTFPVSLNAVKTAYGATGTRTLRAFLAGGSFVANTNSVGANGWIPSSGTIELSDLRDATNLNVTFLGSNTGFYANAQDERYGGQGAFATATITVTATGILSCIGDPDNGSSSYGNTWLLRGGGLCLPQTCENFEVLFVKTGGTTDVISNNNVWQRCNTSRTISATASAVAFGEGSDFDSAVIKGRIKFRRFDNQTELANVYFELNAFAASYGGAEP